MRFRFASIPYWRANRLRFFADSHRENLYNAHPSNVASVNSMNSQVVVDGTSIPDYGGNKLSQQLVDHQFKQSMTLKDNHCDNSFAESLFSRMKAELLDGGVFLKMEDARMECFDYIEVTTIQLENILLLATKVHCNLKYRAV